MAWRGTLCSALLVLLRAHCAAPQAKADAECSSPRQVLHTEPFPRKMFPKETALRYTCESGYKRKAGTSSLIVCRVDSTDGNVKWTNPDLECIRDPSLPATITTEKTPSRPSTVAPSTPASGQDSGSPSPYKNDAMSPGIPTSRTPSSPFGHLTIPASDPSVVARGTPESSSRGTATTQPLTDQYEESTMEDTNQLREKRTPIGSNVAGGAAVLVFILIAIVAWCRYNKRRQQTTTSHTEPTSSIPMLVSSSASTSDETSGPFLNGQDRESVQEQT
ncbi:interleukin-15 receptor subunit alpha isoform X2 [Ambystoma mexicanum]|uniref:interleukin-15 receptor subunit alpha isoform X2 n=1 Tax=Ambystoma mexicanum TaxID=8296 RepID=UPI0037E94E85